MLARFGSFGTLQRQDIYSLFVDHPDLPCSNPACFKMSAADDDSMPQWIAPTPIKLEDNMAPEVKTDAPAPSNPEDDQEKAKLKKQLVKMEAWRTRVFEGVDAATDERVQLENQLKFCVDYCTQLRDEKAKLREEKEEAEAVKEEYRGFYTYCEGEREMYRRMYLDESAFTKKNLAKITALENQVKEIKMELRNSNKKMKSSESPL